MVQSVASRPPSHPSQRGQWKGHSFPGGRVAASAHGASIVGGGKRSPQQAVHAQQAVHGADVLAGRPQQPGSRAATARVLPPQSLRTRNTQCLLDRVRVVATFVDETVEADEDCDRQTTAEEAEADSKFKVRNRVESVGRPGSRLASAGGMVTPTSARRCRMSASPCTPPRRGVDYSSPGRASSFSGHSRRSQSHCSSPFPPGKGTSPSARHMKKIMTAMNRQNYHGSRQVNREVFAGDDALGAKGSLQGSTGGDPRYSSSKQRQDAGDGDAAAPTGGMDDATDGANRDNEDGE